MAESVASPLLDLVIGKLASALWKEVGLISGVSSDIENLRRKLGKIRDVLDDAEKRPIADKALRNWLKELRDVAFDADAVMDEFRTEALRRREEGHDRFTGKVRDFFSSNNPILFRHKMAHMMKDVLRRLDENDKEQKQFHLKEGSASERPLDLDRETSSAVESEVFYGRDKDKNTIVNLLLNEDNDKSVSVLPIFGIGGVGKTAIAQLVFNEESVKQYFNLRIWVCVSDDFDLSRILKAIIVSVTKKPCEFTHIEPMQQLLQKELNGKRFLLVLDDVWNENEAKWDRLKSLLCGGSQGSKIAVTTRNEEVAKIVSSNTGYKLGILSTDDCWNLFRQKAFALGREQENPRLVEIGKEIAKKCGGLPLAAKALGSLMGTKRGEAEWLAIKNSEIWSLPEEQETNILPSLQLSYNHLPSYLKQCFVYCSLFPKDYRFDKEMLIQLWIAEGFIPLSDRNMLAEDIGSQYFNSLQWRSFFQDVEKDPFHGSVRCKMHDLVHDLACRVAGDDFCMINTGDESSSLDKCHYASLLCDVTASKIPDPCYKSKKLRSFLLLMQDEYSSCNIKEINWDMMWRLRYLRVLNLSNSNISELPSTICRLKHLRYLNLSQTDIKAIPKSITRLHNLLTLNVSLCWELKELPEDMKNMVSLRHLDIFPSGLTRMPPGIGGLSNLQLLSMFVVGEEDGRTMKELQHLNHIRRVLIIRNLQNVKNPREAAEANLVTKTNLQKLGLHWSETDEDAISLKTQEDVIESLRPHPDLESLRIHRYGGSSFPSWLRTTVLDPSQSFSKLVFIQFLGLKRCERLPMLGQLPCLKNLSIRDMPSVRGIGKEFYGEAAAPKYYFPSLKFLRLTNLPNLEEWSIEEEEALIERDMMFPRLEHLSVRGCHKLKAVPFIPTSLVHLSCNEEQLSVAAAGNLARLCRLKELTIEGITTSSSASSSSSNKWEVLQHITTLEELTIYNSDQLKCLPEGIMQLHIPTLRTLNIWINKNLTSLGEGEGGLQQPPPLFTSLQHLGIQECNALTCLPEWMGGLTSLRSLFLHFCPNLAMLPDGLQRLTALNQLTIYDCPIVERRCEKEKGEDWHKIAHIPRIKITPIKVEESTSSSSRGSAANFIRGLRLGNCVGGGSAES